MNQFILKFSFQIIAGLLFFSFFAFTSINAEINQSEMQSNLPFSTQLLHNLQAKIKATLKGVDFDTKTNAFAVAPFSYENTTSGTFTSQTDCNIVFTRTLTITDDFVITDLDVGLNLASTYRGDLKVQLTSPTGTTINLLNQLNDGDDNYNVLLDDDSTNPVDNDVATDPLTPLYDANRTAAPHSSLSNFNGKQAKGDWTLTICNIDGRNNNDGRTLTFNSFLLNFEGNTATDCTINSIDFTTTCNDNGTTTINDDYYTISLIPNGLQLGNSYSVSGTYGINSFSESNFSYLSEQTLSVQIPIGIHTDITITDDDNANCQLVSRIIAPAECSTPFTCWAIADEGNPDVLFQYNSTTNQWTEIGSTTVNGIEGLAYDYKNGIIYTANFDEVGTVNLTNGAFTAINSSNCCIGVLRGANGDHNISDIDGMSFDPFTGILWASERRNANGTDNDYIFQINVATGQHIPDAFGPGIDYAVVPEIFDPVNGQNVYDIDDIAIDPYSGDLFVISNQGGTGGVLTKINKADGSVQEVIGNFDEVDDMEALGFYNSGNLFGSTGNNSPDPDDLNRYFLINKLDATLTERASIDPTGTQRDFESCDCLTGAANKISGTIFNDININGQLNGGDIGTGDVLVYLYRDVDADSMFTGGVDILVDTVRTNPDGTYEFEIGSTGDFVITINTDDLPPDHSLTTDNKEATLFISVGQNNTGNDFGYALICELKVDNINSTNCTGTTSFLADWEINLSWRNPPSGDINIYRNGALATTHTPVGNSGTVTIEDVPADAGLSDTIIVQFANDVLCADTLITKRPAPCPPNVAGSNTPGDVCNSLTTSEIAGTVWEDWNFNGAMDEPTINGIQGITVYLYDDCGNITQTTFTDSNGNYQFTGLNSTTTYRVGFELPPAVTCWAKPTITGTDNGSLIQYVDPQNCASLGLADPADYCDSNPNIVLTCFGNGDPLLGGTAKDIDAIVTFPYAGSAGITPTPSKDINADEVGAVWGTAYHRPHQKVFTAAFLKRHAGLGSLGLGGIYTIDYSTPTPTVSPLMTVPNVGTITNRNLPATAADPSRDYEAFELVSKIGLGDLDISGDNNTLWTVNLATKELVSIDISAYNLNPTNTPTNSDINSYKVPNPGCSNDDYMPFAIEIHKGIVYVGVTCTAEQSQDQNDLSISIYAFNSGTFYEVADFPLTYTRGILRNDSDTNQLCDRWQPWTRFADDFNNFGFFNENDVYPCYGSPLLSDIEILEDGSMVVAITDRTGHQQGNDQYAPIPERTEVYNLVAGGDILKLSGNANGTFSIENNGTAGSLTGCGVNNNQGPGGGEFFCEDAFINGSGRDQHQETNFGALLYSRGSGEVVTTRADPRMNINEFETGGLSWLSTSTGQITRSDNYRVYDSGGFGKSNGLGDMELMCAAAPIEIGQYVWYDENEDGLQNTCENTLAGVTVSLYKDGTKIAETLTNATGQYFFSDKNSSDPNLNWIGTNADTTLQITTEYQIVFGESQYANTRLTLGGTDYNITSTHQGDNDNIDSDASLTDINGTTYPVITFTTGTVGCSDHSQSLGLVPACEITPILVSQLCNDNNTGGIETDDYLTININATSTDGASQYEVIFNGVTLATANYNTIVSLEYQDVAQTTRFAADGVSTYSFTIRDVTDSTCSATIMTTAEANCSDCPSAICLPVIFNKKFTGSN